MNSPVLARQRGRACRACIPLSVWTMEAYGGRHWLLPRLTGRLTLNDQLSTQRSAGRVKEAADVLAGCCELIVKRDRGVGFLEVVRDMSLFEEGDRFRGGVQSQLHSAT